MHSDPAAGAPLTVLAFDFGLKRIGIAVGDTITSTAAPRPAIPFGNWTAIEREVRSLQPQFLVVGAPYNANGSEGAIAPAARAFAQELERRFGVPVHQLDERFSSLEANSALKDRRASGARRRRVRREDIDSTAAAIILERWLAGER
jgi:putative holliday junction resolvase